MRIPHVSRPVNRNRRASVFQSDTRPGIKPAAQVECADPTTVMNPETGKCVSKLGCTGQCLTRSFSVATGFNPAAFAICMLLNCGHS